MSNCGFLVSIVVSAAALWPAIAAAQPAGSVHFSTIGSAGITGGDTISRLTLSPSVASISDHPTAPVILRYPIPNESQLSSRPGSSQFGAKYFVVRLRIGHEWLCP